MAWQTFSLPLPPSSISTAVEGLKTIASTTSTALVLVKELLKALSTTATTTLDASQLAIQTAVTAVDAAITALTEDSGVYVLLVPPGSLVLIPDSVRQALTYNIAVSPTTQGLNTQALFTDEPVSTAEAQILQSLFSATGGNAGFVRAVLESFDDLGDANRPQLADTDAVAGAYLVAGASSFADLIPFTNGMSSLLAPGKPTALDAPAIPNPQNLRAKIIAGGAVHLQWAPQPPIVELPTLGTFARVTEVAVIRSTSITFLSASTPYAVFGTSKLFAGQKTDDGLTEVLAVTAYPEEDYPTTYTDTSVHAAGGVYHYAVSFRVTLGTSQQISQGGGSDMTYLRLSNASRVYFSKAEQGAPRSITGVPPDWYRTPRTVDLFPALGDLLSKVSTFTRQFGDTTLGYSDMLKTNVTALEQQIQGYTDLAAQLTAAVSAISSFSSVNLGTVSSRFFSGVGGTNFVRKDIVKAFGDVSDPQRPPFDGNEFVSGVVILATTPSAIALLNQILGSISAGVSAVSAALERIDVQLSVLETAVFNEDLSVHAAVPVTTLATTTAALTSLVGEDASYCYHSFEPDTAFDDQLNPA